MAERSFFTKVAGAAQRNADGSDRQKIIARCSVGERLILVREPENPDDPNAVAVYRRGFLWGRGRQVGYLPEHVVDGLATRMDKGARVSARVAASTNTKPRAGHTRGMNLEISVRD